MVGFTNQRGTPAGEGTTRALAMETGRRLNGACSRTQAWDKCGNGESFCICTCAITSDSFAARIQTMSTRERGTEVVGVLGMVGEMWRGWYPGKWSVHFPHVQCALVGLQKIETEEVVSPSALMTVLSNERSDS